MSWVHLHFWYGKPRKINLNLYKILAVADGNLLYWHRSIKQQGTYESCYPFICLHVCLLLFVCAKYYLPTRHDEYRNVKMTDVQSKCPLGNCRYPIDLCTIKALGYTKDNYSLNSITVVGIHFLWWIFIISVLVTKAKDQERWCMSKQAKLFIITALIFITSSLGNIRKSA